MCGIAGIVGRRAVNEKAVAAMTALQHHRGPDDGGLWTANDGKAVLGHRRLSIIDTSDAGHQPMTDPTGALTLVFNGEIYNYRELAERLKAEGAVFRSASDTEVLMAAYRAWGLKCVEEFNGMFAFALHDRDKRRLVCARDRFGEKPFLLAHGEDFVAFASEYKALLSLADVPSDWDRTRMARFLKTGSEGLDDDRHTVFSGIEQLLPGERMVIDLDSLDVAIDRYWSLPPKPDTPLNHDDAVAQFRELLTDSVRLRLRADVPVGSCLSGGLDSSAIVCLARQLLGDDADYQTFTGRFPGSKADEWAHAEPVVQATKATARITEPTVDRFLENLDDFIWANELPVASSSQFAQWSVFKLAHEHDVTVLLDGQGADEILGGYEQYFSAYLSDTGGTDEAAIRDRYPAALSQRDQGWKTRLPPGLKRFLGQLSGKGSDVAFGLDPAVLGNNAAADHDPAPGHGTLHRALARDALHTHLPTLLRYGDRNSMAHSREVRLPFTDHRIAELAFAASPDSLMGAVQTKRLLREAMAGILPEPVRTRWNKQGFRPPQETWFHKGLATHLRERIGELDFAARGLWAPRWWDKALDRFEAGEDHLAWVLWQPVIVEAWAAGFVDRIRHSRKEPALREGQG